MYETLKSIKNLLFSNFQFKPRFFSKVYIRTPTLPTGRYEGNLVDVDFNFSEIFRQKKI